MKFQKKSIQNTIYKGNVMCDMYWINGLEGKYLTFVNPRNNIILKCWKPNGERSFPYERGVILTFGDSKFICRVQTIEEGKNLYPEYFI